MLQDLIKLVSPLRGNDNTCLVTALAEAVYNDLTFDDLTFGGLEFYNLIINALQHAKANVGPTYDNTILLKLICDYINTFDYAEHELAYVTSFYENLHMRNN